MVWQIPKENWAASDVPIKDDFNRIEGNTDQLRTDVDTHTAADNAHGAVSLATANKIIIRDAYGRAKIAAPSAPDDIAQKNTVDTVQTALTNHQSLTNTAHGGIARSSNAGTGNLNTLINSGMYRIDPPITNGPGGVDYGQLLVIHGANDTITQIVTDYGSNNIYWRSGNPPDVGGSGAWGAWRKIWHDGNDGSGSGLDADMVEGYHASFAAWANYIAIRDSSGFINATGFNSSGAADNGAAVNYVYDNGDGYLRKKALNNVKSELLAKVYGNAAYSDAIGASSVLTKTIPLGGTYRNGMIVIRPTALPVNASYGTDYGAIVYFGTDYSKTKGIGAYSGGYSNTHWASAWSRRQAGYAIGAFNEPGNNAAGGSYIRVNDVYISGTNLIIDFYNTYTSSTSLGCNIDWECW